MPRKTIYLTDEELEKVKAISEKENLSETEAVKRLFSQEKTDQKLTEIDQKLNEIANIIHDIAILTSDIDLIARITQRMAGKAAIYAYHSSPKEIRDHYSNNLQKLEETLSNFADYERKKVKEMMSNE